MSQVNTMLYDGNSIRASNVKKNGYIKIDKMQGV